MPNPQPFHPHGLLRQPVLVRFRALRGFGVLAGSTMVALVLDDDSGPVALPLFSDLMGCACRGSSPVKVSSVALEPGAITSE